MVVNATDEFASNINTNHNNKYKRILPKRRCRISIDGQRDDDYAFYKYYKSTEETECNYHQRKLIKANKKITNGFR